MTDFPWKRSKNTLPNRLATRTYDPTEQRPHKWRINCSAAAKTRYRKKLRQPGFTECSGLQNCDRQIGGETTEEAYSNQPETTVQEIWRGFGGGLCVKRRTASQCYGFVTASDYNGKAAVEIRDKIPSVYLFLATTRSKVDFHEFSVS